MNIQQTDDLMHAEMELEELAGKLHDLRVAMGRYQLHLAFPMENPTYVKINAEYEATEKLYAAAQKKLADLEVPNVTIDSFAKNEHSDTWKA